MLAGAREWWRGRSAAVRAGVGGGVLATLVTAVLLAVQAEPSLWAGVLSRVFVARTAPLLPPEVGLCLPCVAVFLLPGFLGGAFAALRYRSLAAADPGPLVAVVLVGVVILLPVTTALAIGLLAWVAVAAALLVSGGSLAALLFGTFLGALLFGVALGGGTVFALLGSVSVPAGLLAARAWAGRKREE